MHKPNVYIDEVILTRLENTFKATICCCCFSSTVEYEGIIQYLHNQERNYYDTLKFEKRIRSYLIGRFVAKQAVASLINEENLTNIIIKSGIFGQPITISNKQNIQVSITHCDDFGVAIAFPEAHPMGIDLEKINLKNRDVLERQITEDEKDLINVLPLSYETGLTLLWTAKEALSKVLKTGLMTPFEVLEISKIELQDNDIMCYYKNFPQYRVIAFTIGGYMSAIAYPSRTHMNLDICSLKEKFTFVNLNE
ncbi:4'-phosphopantetheinyl transferase superfamily protein [Pelosinus sp. Bkl1]|uniref:4'-phosphopantetheinyl transferase superfamily protein n=1 Tax=Pelosinus baikalensis TaxID=2892015 RepID=A0ABS8HU45_9FIRM|nr:4'-phosphopantetheinyl transferase superfamily protein [Pelosinus baikalensis]